MAKNPAAEKRYRITVKVLGVLALFLAYSLFRSATAYVGLTASHECFDHYLKMTRQPSSWEKYWGGKTIDFWKFPFANQKEIAVDLVRGKTLIGVQRNKVIEKMGEPSLKYGESHWIYDLPMSFSESVCRLHVIFDKEIVADSYLEVES